MHHLAVSPSSTPWMRMDTPVSLPKVNPSLWETSSSTRKTAALPPRTPLTRRCRLSPATWPWGLFTVDKNVTRITNNVRPDDWPHSACLALAPGALDDDWTDDHHHLYHRQAASHNIPHAGTSGTFVEPDFSGLDQAYIEEHIGSDTDTTMGAPEGLTTASRES
jgi:hypothetical protein